jgi:hypothetical protein
MCRPSSHCDHRGSQEGIFKEPTEGNRKETSNLNMCPAQEGIKTSPGNAY